MRWFLAILLGARALSGVTLADIARGVRELALDPEECYRVRDLTLAREDARIFFTDGYLVFSRPVAGRPIAAVFTTDVQGGEGEVLLLPPTRGERRSLATHTGSPNMSERILTAVLLFTDHTHRELTAEMRRNPFNRKVPEMGLLAAPEWSPMVRNLAASYETRLALDLFDPASSASGFFAATFSGHKLGNFDILCDPRSQEQILVGRVAVRGARTFFDIWTSFQGRSWRSGARETAVEFTLRDYRIEAAIEPGLDLAVTARVRLRPREAARVLPFEIAHPMRIDAVAIDGRPAEVLQRDALRDSLVRGTGNDLFLVAAPQPLDPARDYEIEFRHHGRVIQDAGNQVYYVGARGNWYPNRRGQFISYDLTFRHPNTLDIVLPGELVERKEEGDWRITRHRTNRPVRFAGFNLGRYNVVRETRAGYTVVVYANQSFEEALQARPREPLIVVAPPPLWSQRRPRQPPPVILAPDPPPPPPRLRLEELASEVASALEFMVARFGPPALPTLAVSPVPGAFGQGFPGLLYLSTLAYLEPGDLALTRLGRGRQTFFTELLQAHETAHQWWGNVVTAPGYQDVWLMEALANYSALLYIEKRKGRRAIDAVLEEYRAALLEKLESGETVESAGPIVLGDRLETSQTPQAARAIVYGKGSWILHMLRARMGDARFLEMLAALRRRYEWKTVSTAQFRELAAAHMPSGAPDADLESFFDQWVHGTGIPTLTLTHAVKGKGRALRVTGTVTQTGVDEDFSVAIPIEVQFARGKPITHIVLTGPDPTTFTIPVTQPPARVLLDPARTVLRR